ncbi:dickkopf-related protein 2 [Denticeps clupeoides]|uniref:Dickkopf-related protein 2 n=1 Tax=Denticeps clupeoides TaxID=299321 RepID=A0AAY4AZM7_9TELE|nr:dickkopf-related protein 2 [Denticeps clupeoides]
MRMSGPAWRCVLGLLLAAARTARVGSEENFIKSALGGIEGPTPATSRSGAGHLGPRGSEQVYPCRSDKECTAGTYCHSPQHTAPRCSACRRRNKRCHRDAMCCQNNRCSNHVCVPVSESVHRFPLKGHKKLYTKEKRWKKSGKEQAKSAFKGHEGDPCLRSSDCSEGHCCARHFWTKICKPVLRQGEVCTKHRKKGSHGLEIFQRCDCARDLVCKVWKDATASSRSRLHICQKI